MIRQMKCTYYVLAMYLNIAVEYCHACGARQKEVRWQRSGGDSGFAGWYLKAVTR